MVYFIGPNVVFNVAIYNIDVSSYNIDSTLESSLLSRKNKILTPKELSQVLSGFFEDITIDDSGIKYDVLTQEKYSSSIPKINMSRIDNCCFSNATAINNICGKPEYTLKISTGMSGWRHEIDDDGYVQATPRYP